MNLFILFFSLINFLVLNVKAGIIGSLGSIAHGITNGISNGISNVFISNNDSGYGKNIDYGTSRKLDVYFNERNVNMNQLKPVVIHFYGGAWVKGSKDEYANFGRILRDNNYVAVLPNYVLFPFGRIEDMVEDVHSAIMWTYYNIAKFGGDPNNITISGHSAGAHLTALTVLKSILGYPNKNEYLQPLTFVKKLVLLNGPYDFDDFSIVKQLFRFEIENGLVEELVSILMNTKNISPTDLLKAFLDQSINTVGFPKFIFFYTSEDIIVPQSSVDGLIGEIKRTMRDADVRYIYLHDMDHNTLTQGIKDDIKVYENLYLNLIQA